MYHTWYILYTVHCWACTGFTTSFGRGRAIREKRKDDYVRIVAKVVPSTRAVAEEDRLVLVVQVKFSSVREQFCFSIAAIILYFSH